MALADIGIAERSAGQERQSELSLPELQKVSLPFPFHISKNGAILPKVFKIKSRFESTDAFISSSLTVCRLFETMMDAKEKMLIEMRDTD